ncbi:MAG: ATP-binding protein [Lachnospiraceae bacterium]|nr:ATP-binding protein [Lachnospiraceae bacterium]
MIPLKIETLLEGQVVEKNRVEYKEGWNPSDIIHTICAFANDLDNVNGGYVVIGVAAEDGIPILPPVGIKLELLDNIQQEIFQYCNRIEPRYIPNIEVLEYPNPDTHLIYLKCSAGDAGPYQAPVDVYSKKGEKSDKTMKYWIRPASLTTTAKPNEISELYEKFNAIPYDDRINRVAKLDDIRRGYVEDLLRDSKSSLVGELNNRTLEDLLVSLEVANETDTDLAIRNIGVLMFTDRPDKLIPGALINLVKFNTEEAEASRDFVEKTFTGPIWKQIKDALGYIQTNVIEGKVEKIENQAEALHFYNYPYNALEEAVVNAVFHKSYRDDSPVEIRIYTDEIVILNYPGPAKWIDMDKFSQGKVRARKYRNRRIGEFFKELDLSEKQSTGIPTILNELKKNGSPEPEFHTDDERNYLETTIRIRDGFETTVNFNQKSERSLSEVLSEVLKAKEYEKVKIIIDILQEKGNISPKEAEIRCKKSSATTRRYMKLLVETGYVIQEGSTNSIVYKNILY